MTFFAALAVGFAAADAATMARLRRPGLAGLAAGALVVEPFAALLGAAGVATAWSVRRWRRARRHAAEMEGEVVVLAELTSLGVAAGLSFADALRRAATDVQLELQSEVARVLGRARVDGQAVAFAAASGRAGALYRLAGRALATGAPLTRSLEAFVAAQRDEARSKRLAASRRLPVRLMVPLTLLILPGFVVLTAGPALLSGLARIGG